MTFKVLLPTALWSMLANDCCTTLSPTTQKSMVFFMCACVSSDQVVKRTIFRAKAANTVSSSSDWASVAVWTPSDKPSPISNSKNFLAILAKCQKPQLILPYMPRSIAVGKVWFSLIYSRCFCASRFWPTSDNSMSLWGRQARRRSRVA